MTRYAATSEGTIPFTPEQEAEFDALVTAAQAQAIPQLIDSILDAAQKYLDDFAQTLFYDNILSACTYATSSVLKFKVEGQYAVDMRDLTWGTLYQILLEVQSGTRPVPSGFAELLPELPELAWPVLPA